ncbi:MAG: hypothetical protein H6867_11125 [Rhodospirillales bacterium]|nr:hypothetical protein [Rhodospirillales bacterium]MCB9996681.1 hypothetical protein [Rhodospirillales bacterium]
MKKDQPDETIFNAIRKAYAQVADKASHVKIRMDLIEAYANSLPDALPENTWDEEDHYKGTLADTVNYALIVDAVNFGSGYKPHLVNEGLKLERASIYFTVARRIKDYFVQNGPFTAEGLARITAGDVKEIFGLGADGAYSKEFAGLCAQSLRDLGNAVQREASGDFVRYVEDTAPLSADMLKRLTAMPGFNDVHNYKGIEAPFYKRAQHNITVLNLIFNRFGKQLFSDMDQLTMFADNAVPRTLFADGILEYSEALQNEIRRGGNIPSGSEEEIEIRACAAHAVEKIAEIKGMKASDIDFILWHKSVEESRYKATPSHRTLTWFY